MIKSSLQTITEDDKSGRVMSFFTMAFMGMAPFGTLLEGVQVASEAKIPPEPQGISLIYNNR